MLPDRCFKEEGSDSLREYFIHYSQNKLISKKYCCIVYDSYEEIAFDFNSEPGKISLKNTLQTSSLGLLDQPFVMFPTVPLLNFCSMTLHYDFKNC